MGFAIEDLLKGYADLRKFLRLELSHDDAEDIAQSSFEKALRYSKDNEVLSPANLIFSISRHLRIDADRRRKRAKEEAFEEDLHGGVQSVICEVTPERQLASQQRVTSLMTVLDGLAPRCREAFVLCKIHGLTYDEAATEMGISSSVVRKYLIQALKACRSVAV